MVKQASKIHNSPAASCDAIVGQRSTPQAYRYVQKPALCSDLGAIARFKQLTEDILPRIAREQHWPVHFDHCFKRICLDNAFEDVWYKHLQRPAEKHLQEPELSRTIEVAEQLVAEGRPALQRLNQNSLQWRRTLKDAGPVTK